MFLIFCQMREVWCTGNLPNSQFSLFHATALQHHSVLRGELALKTVKAVYRTVEVVTLYVQFTEAA